MKLNLYTTQLQDPVAQENARNTLDFVQSQPWLKGEWKFFEVSLGNVTNFRFKHNLGYRPKDIILTAVTDGVAIIFNYDLFTDEFLDITTNGVTTIRFFAGSYKTDSIF